MLYTNWEAISKDGITATVKMDVGIVCYSLSTGKHRLTVKVNDQSKTVLTRAIENTLNEKKTIKLHTVSMEIPLDEESPNLLDMAVVWEFNGSYSGHFIEKLELADLILLPGGEAEDTEESTNEDSTKLPSEENQAPVAAPVANPEEEQAPTEQTPAESPLT